MSINFKQLYSTDIKNYENDLANLRIKIFREFPYLYEGDIEYEQKYLSRYSNAKESMIVIAIEGKRIIGATTCIPLIEEDKEFQLPFLKRGLDIKNSFYFGESIILSEYRGRGIGSQFFKLREKHSEEVFPKLDFTCFCSVERMNHPLEPKDYRPLHDFWMRQGYREYPNLSVLFPWKDIDQEAEDFKKMIYWIKKWKKRSP